MELEKWLSWLIGQAKHLKAREFHIRYRLIDKRWTVELVDEWETSFAEDGDTPMQALNRLLTTIRQKITA